MKITNNLKGLVLLFIALVLGLSSLNVNAATTPSSIKVKSKSSLYYYTEKKGTDYINGYNFYRKELDNGTFAYCSSNINTHVPAGKTLKLTGEVTDKGLAYIIQNGYPNKSFTGNNLKDYYITQSAIWRYYDETRSSSNWPKSAFSSKSTGMKKYVYDLVQAAKKANSIKEEYKVEATVSSETMSLVGNDFVSEPISVTLTNTTSSYTVSFKSAPEGTYVKDIEGNVKDTFKKGEQFIVVTPNSSSEGTIKVKIAATGKAKRVYNYTTGSSYYQDLIPVKVYTVETKSVSTTIKLSFKSEVTKLNISKQDITSKAELPGATLIIKDTNGNVVDTWISGSVPHYIEGLVPGNYTLTETIAPVGYKLSSETINFTLEADGQVKSVVMYNEKEITKVKISKQDIADGKEVPGATLIIKDATGKEVARWVSGNEPHYIEGLAEGSYTLTEIQAPNGYKLSSETISFRLLATGEIQSVVMYNEKDITRVRISKQDLGTKSELAGATLVIKDASGNEVSRFVTDGTPKYIEGLAPGNYTLSEAIAPEGYKLSNEVISFTLSLDGKTNLVTLYNEKEVTKVKISKQDITSKEELAGATLIIKDNTGKVVDKWVSGNEPHYIEGLNPGDYSLTEEIAPDGYALSSETISFTLKADGTVQTVVMYNEKAITKLKISKQDIADGKEIPGATLIIKDSTGKEVARWISGTTPHYIEGLAEGTYTLTEEIAPDGYQLSSETISFTLKADGTIKSTIMYNARNTEVTKVKISKQDMTTKEELPGATLIIKDSTGKEVTRWVSGNTPHYIEGLVPGDYTLTEEIAPDGYRLSSETVNFTINSDGTLTSVVMYNARNIVKLQVSKQDITTKTELAGASLAIKNKDGKIVESWISTNKPHYTENLSVGTYYLIEEKAPVGYKLNTKEIEFTLEDTDKVTNVVIYNEKNDTTKVRISKQDITNKTELAGATLIVRDSNGEIVDKWISGNEPHYIEGLSVGKYTLTEALAPNGYILSSETIEFTVTNDGNIVDVVMYNQPKLITKVMISKQDMTTKKELAGATLIIKDKNGKVIDTWVSGTNAHYIEGLDAGVYTLTEIIAPSGYALSTETIEFTVKDDGSITNVVMYNERLITVPITDLDINSATVVLGSVITFMGAGILVFYKKKMYN